MAKLENPADALPLLAFKIAPRQFDISYRFSNISLRDQIVRAQMLVGALIEAELVRTESPVNDGKFQLLICGAGAAGLAAAKEAEANGISFVLIEKGPTVPGGVLMKTAKRYVSTAMYEWPNPNHTAHDYPLTRPKLLGHHNSITSTLDLAFDKPVEVNQFGNEIYDALQTDLNAWEANFNLFLAGANFKSIFSKNTTLSHSTKKKLGNMLYGKTSLHGVPLHSAKLPDVRLEKSGIAITQVFNFQYVIYAVGYAVEAEHYNDEKQLPFIGYDSRPFWEADSVSENNLGFTEPPRVAILGSGDGALQDALRCLVIPTLRHPLDVWDKLMEFSQIKGLPLYRSKNIQLALARIAAADAYTTGGAIWTHKKHIFESLDEEFKNIIKFLIETEGKRLKPAVEGILREDVQAVTIINRDGYFSKAYALNRFLVLLIEEIKRKYYPNITIPLNISSGNVRNFEQVGSDVRGARLTVNHLSGGTTVEEYELVIIRGGLDVDKSPTQLLGLSGRDTGRAELGRIPPPIRPPKR